MCWLETTFKFDHQTDYFIKGTGPQWPSHQPLIGLRTLAYWVCRFLNSAFPSFCRHATDGLFLASSFWLFPSCFRCRFCSWAWWLNTTTTSSRPWWVLPVRMRSANTLHTLFHKQHLQSQSAAIVPLSWDSSKLCVAEQQVSLFILTKRSAMHVHEKDDEISLNRILFLKKHHL